MSQLIKNGVVVEDEWQLLGAEEALPDTGNPQNKYLLPLPLWLENLDTVAGLTNVGVWLTSDATCEALRDQLKSLPVIAIDFPVFSDGRGYSLARQLRDHYGYEGELRAIGDVLKDQMFFYQRCGFDSFLVRTDRPVQGALSSLQDFNVVYQAAADDRTAANRKR